MNKIEINTSAIFDSHLHLTSPQFSDDEIERLLKRAEETHVTAVMNVATDIASFERSLKIKDQLQSVPIQICNWYQAAATTPHDATLEDPFFSKVEAAAFERQIQAVGETGLDYYYEHSPRDVQKEVCARYIDLARRAQLPLIIHCRDAFNDFFDLITTYGKGDVRGVLHCFTGDLANAKALVDMGWYISMSGIVTYSKSQELKAIAKFLPKEVLLVETDAPYLAPQPVRGKRNEPSYLHHTLAHIAELKQCSFDDLAHFTYQNAKALFGEIGGR